MFLDAATHRYMSTLLMAAYAKHLTGRHFANHYTIRQVRLGARMRRWHVVICCSLPVSGQSR